MMTDNHIPHDVLCLYEASRLEPGEAARVEGHLTGCGVCREAAQQIAGQIAAFMEALDAEWTRERIRAMGLGHPPSSELEALWMGEPAEPWVGAHVASCDECTEHMKRLDKGYAVLADEDPLGQSAWGAMVTQRFAAGIEMVVEAAAGAFTTAAGMVRDVMTPQATARLTPSPSLAMGGEGGEAGAGVTWHDASFQTDELSGEITGSTDNTTGRGIITVVINKSGEFVARPPIVELINASGKAVTTQSALDIGDRFSAVFSNLDHGRYLVAIREPGGA